MGTQEITVTNLSYKDKPIQTYKTDNSPINLSGLNPFKNLKLSSLNPFKRTGGYRRTKSNKKTNRKTKRRM